LGLTPTLTPIPYYPIPGKTEAYNYNAISGIFISTNGFRKEVLLGFVRKGHTNNVVYTIEEGNLCLLILERL
jgi:hypothetical protein